jgi:hypothetical protein
VLDNLHQQQPFFVFSLSMIAVKFFANALIIAGFYFHDLSLGR